MEISNKIKLYQLLTQMINDQKIKTSERDLLLAKVGLWQKNKNTWYDKQGVEYKL